MNALRPLLPPAAVTLSVIFLGSSFVATRYVIAQTDPASLAFIRYFGAFLCLVPFYVVCRRMAIPGRGLLMIIVAGMLQYGIFQFLLNTGLQHIPASRGAVLFALVPILTMIAAAVLGYESMTWRKTLAAFMSIAGISLALGEKAFATGASASDWTGEALFLAGVCCGATYNALASRLLRIYPIIPVTALMIFSGVVFLAVPAAWEGLFSGIPTFTGGGWVAVLFLIIPAGALGFFLFNWALQRMTPTRTAIFVPISPLAATLFGALILDEEISSLFLVGLTFVVGGIWLANWRAGAGDT